MSVVLTIYDGWAELVLNRPARRNAIDGMMACQLRDALQAIEQDVGIRAVVLRGADGAFCSGLDVKAFNADPSPAWLAEFPAVWDDVHTRLLASRQVLIVVLEGYAINGGAALALAGDLLVCGASAFLQIGEIAIGMAAPRNAAWLALRHGEAVAARLCLLGDRVAAPELLRLGLATEVVDDAATVQRACELAGRISAYQADAVHRIKTGMRAATMQMPAASWLAACARSDPLTGSRGGSDIGVPDTLRAPPGID
jgi:enoyl-CoA hydratase/carnithine racemase